MFAYILLFSDSTCKITLIMLLLQVCYLIVLGFGPQLIWIHVTRFGKWGIHFY